MICVFLSVCLSVCLSVYLSIYVSVCLYSLSMSWMIGRKKVTYLLPPPNPSLFSNPLSLLSCNSELKFAILQIIVRKSNFCLQSQLLLSPPGSDIIQENKKPSTMKVTCLLFPALMLLVCACGGGLVSGQGRLYSVEEWCQVKVGYILWRTGVMSR